MSAREVDFVSTNVATDTTAQQRIRDAGFRGLPVVERDGEFIHGTDLARVAALIDQEYDATPVLSAETLAERYATVLDAAIRFAVQIPAQHLDDKLPHRDRTYLTLINHLIQISIDFLEVTRGASLVGDLAASLPEANAGIDDLARRVVDVKAQLTVWRSVVSTGELEATVTTYFGDQSLHAVLERAVWHSAQHTRQLMMVLDGLGIAPDGPLAAADFDQLPMPVNVWDG